MYIPKVGTEFFRDLTALGGFTFYGLIMVLCLGLKEYSLFWLLFWGLVIEVAVVVAIRSFYFKKRPKPQDYHTFIQKLDASSFPSLHTARVVLLWFVFSSFFNNYVVTSVLCIAGLLIAYSRIYLQKHDWWDLLGGAVLGVGSYLLMWWI